MTFYTVFHIVVGNMAPIGMTSRIYTVHTNLNSL